MAIIQSYKNKRGTRSSHYDMSGNKVLSSYRGSNGRVKHYDANGRHLGSTREGGYGHIDHYDNHGKRVGTFHIKPSGSVYYSSVTQTRYFDDDRDNSSESVNSTTPIYYSNSNTSPSYANNLIHTNQSSLNRSDKYYKKTLPSHSNDSSTRPHSQEPSLVTYVLIPTLIAVAIYIACVEIATELGIPFGIADIGL